MRLMTQLKLVRTLIDNFDLEARILNIGKYSAIGFGQDGVTAKDSHDS